MNIFTIQDWPTNIISCSNCFNHVDFVEKPTTTCKYCTAYTVDSSSYTLLMVCSNSGLDSTFCLEFSSSNNTVFVLKFVTSGFNGNWNSPVSEHLHPVSITSLLTLILVDAPSYIFTPSLLKRDTHPASANFPVLINQSLFISGPHNASSSFTCSVPWANSPIGTWKIFSNCFPSGNEWVSFFPT